MARIAVYSRWRVQGEHGPLASVDRADGSSLAVSGCPADAGAENTVHQDTVFLEKRLFPNMRTMKRKNKLNDETLLSDKPWPLGEPE